MPWKGLRKKREGAVKVGVEPTREEGVGVGGTLTKDGEGDTRGTVGQLKEIGKMRKL